VFTYKGQPVKQVNKRAWCNALKRGRYRGLSLARSAPHVGELARAGRDTALRVTSARGLGAEKMVRRYAHLAAKHLAVYAGNTESHGTITAQAPDFHGTPRLQIVEK
jgi:hypothetical protein